MFSSHITKALALLVIALISSFQPVRAEEETIDVDDLLTLSVKSDYVLITGRIKSPGSYRFTPNMRILELISIADGCGDDADLDLVRVYRGDPLGRQTIEVDLDRVMEGELEGDITLKAGDIIYIPKDGTGVWNFVVKNVLPVLYLATSVLTLYLVVNK